MAKPRKAKLKVFRTSIGFHDAYVAAPSRKAALDAWGAGTDLFAAGVAELVTDPELMREALDRPGEVVRKSRGSAAEQIKALGKVSKPKARAKVEAGSRIESGMTKQKKRGPRPSRTAVDKAEKALERAKARHRAAAAKVRAEEQALAEALRRFRSAMAEWAE